MRRRDFIAGLGAAGWPLTASAQQPTKRVIGVLVGDSGVNDGAWKLILESLRDAGFVEGRNLTIEYRFAEGNYDRLPILAADLVHLGTARRAPARTTKNRISRSAIDLMRDRHDAASCFARSRAVRCGHAE